MRGCNVDQPRNLAKSVTVEWWFGKSGSSNFDSSLITPIGILKFTSNPCVLLVLS
jgi:hypothetical protein